MFDLASRTELSVKDFKSYPDKYPFRDPTYLTRSPDTLRKELAKMRVEDEVDDQLIADQLQTHVITRSQSQAAERAKQNDRSEEHTSELQSRSDLVCRLLL